MRREYTGRFLRSPRKIPSVASRAQATLAPRGARVRKDGATIPSPFIAGRFADNVWIILCPILYAVIGSLVWMLVALLFNLAAGMIGGVELEVD